MKILFFRNSDNIIKEFSSQNYNDTYSYYWFNDSYTHFKPWNPRYLHLFLKEPKNVSVRFFVRNMGQEYKDLIQNLKSYKEKKTPEAPILMSKDTLIPDLVADAGENPNENTKVWTIIFPKEYAGNKIYLRDEGNNPIPFNQDSTLVSIFPELNDSIPFQIPDDYDQWNPISFEELNNRHE